jgi:hypothetical protein
MKLVIALIGFALLCSCAQTTTNTPPAPSSSLPQKTKIQGGKGAEKFYEGS